jgi:hypothetical protein
MKSIVALEDMGCSLGALWVVVYENEWEYVTIDVDLVGEIYKKSFQSPQI